MHEAPLFVRFGGDSYIVHNIPLSFYRGYPYECHPMLLNLDFHCSFNYIVLFIVFKFVTFSKQTLHIDSSSSAYNKMFFSLLLPQEVVHPMFVPH